MICPTCNTPTAQYNAIGDTISCSNSYKTWRVERCPKCGQLLLELYATCTVKTEQEASDMVAKTNEII